MWLLQLLFWYSLQKTQQSGPKHKSKYDSSMISMFSIHVKVQTQVNFNFVTAGFPWFQSHFLSKFIVHTVFPVVMLWYTTNAYKSFSCTFLWESWIFKHCAKRTSARRVYIFELKNFPASYYWVEFSWISVAHPHQLLCWVSWWYGSFEITTESNIEQRIVISWNC